MTEGKWALAKIAAVQLRWPDLPDDIAVKRLQSAQENLAKMGSGGCDCCSSYGRKVKFRRHDVSGEPRVPAGLTGGGEWEEDETNDNVSDLGPGTQRPPVQIADIDRRLKCNERCSSILERWKSFRASQANAVAYDKCMAECMAEPG